MFRYPLAEHLRVTAWWKRQKRGAEAGTERCLGLRHPSFSAGDFRCIARQKVIHRPFERQPRNRGQDAKGIGGEHHDVARMAALSERDRVVDERDRIRGTGVLGELVVVQIEQTRFGIDDDVLEYGSKAASCRVDLRLGLGRQSNRFCVAAALEIEHAAIAPPVLIVSDQHPFVVARQRSLAGAGQAKEERDVARRADIGRAMHRQDVAQRQDVVEHAEDRFFHLARIAGAANEHQLFGEVQRDDDLRVGAMPLWIGLKAWRIDDGELRHVRPGRCRTRIDDEEIAREEVMPRVLSDDPDGQTVGWIGAGIAVLDVELFVRQRADQIAVQRIEVRGLHRPVHLAPGDLRLARRFANHELVIGGPAGVLPRTARERTPVGNQSFLVPNGFLVQSCRREVPPHAIGVNALALETAPFGEFTSRRGSG